MRLPVKVMSERTDRRIISSAAVIVAALALTACKSNHLHTGSVPTDGYKTRHPIVITEAPETLDIPVGSQSRSLSPDLAGTIEAFAKDARARGDGGIEVLVPSGSANETAALYVARQIRSVIVKSGVRGDMVIAQTYRVDDPNILAPVRLSFLRMKAVTNRCGIWESDLSSDNNNRSYSEFGCSTQSNLAAIVSNPTDLIYPRASKPGDQARRSVVFDKYREGNKTATEYGDNDKGQLAEIGE